MWRHCSYLLCEQTQVLTLHPNLEAQGPSYCWAVPVGLQGKNKDCCGCTCHCCRGPCWIAGCCHWSLWSLQEAPIEIQNLVVKWTDGQSYMFKYKSFIKSLTDKSTWITKYNKGAKDMDIQGIKGYRPGRWEEALPGNDIIKLIEGCTQSVYTHRRPVQDCGLSTANALETPQTCTNPWTSTHSLEQDSNVHIHIHLQIHTLTQWGLATPNGDRDLGQHWLR